MPLLPPLIRPGALRHPAGSLLALGLLLLCCQRSPARAAERSPGTRTERATAATQPIYEAGLAEGWLDYGWAPRELKPNSPALLDLSNRGGWIIARPGFTGRPAGLRFRFRAPSSFGDFLEVRLDSGVASVFPRVRVEARHRVDLEGGWSEAWVSGHELNPAGQAFDRIVFRAAEDVSTERVALDAVGFTDTGPAGQAPARAQVKARDVQLSVQCKAPARRISPGIYGIAYDARLDAQTVHQWQLGATARRWGGNATSRYNWELGNAWNTAQDWYFRNVDYTGIPGYTYANYLDDNIAHGVQTALTIPTLGWVAKDRESYSFPVATFGPQQAVDPTTPGAGNGVDPGGEPIPPGPPELTSQRATPEFMGRWVQAIRKRDAQTGVRSVDMYILDNEPALWNHTHRDVHPEPLGYDELLERTLAYGAAVRKADPEAVIAGPAEWGWPAYFYSAKDAKAGFLLAPDRRMHGNVPLTAWLLRKVREHEKKTGVRILDVLDLHFYPQGEGIGVGENGGTDPETNARRIRSTRALWDPTYVDESYIKEPVRLLPRMRQWIQENAPGLRMSIGEYSFGAERHMSSGLALAEALGRFGQEGLDHAFYWTYPPANTPAFWAFRAYRNFDGKGARFLDHSLPARSNSAGNVSVFASRDASGEHVVAVLLNLDPERPAMAQLDLGGCGLVTSRRAFRFTGEAAGFTQLPEPAAATASQAELLPPYSITVLDLRLSPPPKVKR